MIYTIFDLKVIQSGGQATGNGFRGKRKLVRPSWQQRGRGGVKRGLGRGQRGQGTTQVTR